MFSTFTATTGSPDELPTGQRIGTRSDRGDGSSFGKRRAVFLGGADALGVTGEP